MKITECMVVAMRNLITKNALTFRVLLGLTTIVLFIVCAISYRVSFYEKLNAMEEENKRDCVFTVYQEADGKGQSALDLKYKKNKEKWEADCVCEFKPLLPFAFDQYEDGVAYEDVCMTINKEKRKGKKSWENIQENHAKKYVTQEFSIMKWTESSEIFPTCIKNENKETYLCGQYPSQEGQLLVSDYLLNEFGYPYEEQKDLLGEGIRIEIQKKDNNYVLFDDYKITGIFRADCMEERDESLLDKQYNHLYVYVKAEDCEKFYLYDENQVRYYFTSYEKMIAAYEAANDKERAVLSTQGLIYYVLEREFAVVAKVLFWVFLGFALAILVYLITITYFFFQRNIRFMTIMRALGMEEKNVFVIMVLEIVFCSMMAVLLGGYGSVLLLNILEGICSNSIGVSIPFSFGNVGSGAVISFLLILLLFGIEGVYFYRKSVKTDLAEILQEEAIEKN